MLHRAFSLLAIAAALAGLATPAVAAYPDKPVRIVVPNPPGGAVDVVTRKVAQKLTVQTGQSFGHHWHHAGRQRTGRRLHAAGQ